MRIRLFTFVIGAISLATVGQASIIFRPGEKVKYVAPGEEEVSDAPGQDTDEDGRLVAEPLEHYGQQYQEDHVGDLGQ